MSAHLSEHVSVETCARRPGFKGLRFSLREDWYWQVCVCECWSKSWHAYALNLHWQIQYGGFLKRGYHNIDGLQWKIPSRNGWFGGTYLLGNLHTCSLGSSQLSLLFAAACCGCCCGCGGLLAVVAWLLFKCCCLLGVVGWLLFLVGWLVGWSVGRFLGLCSYLYLLLCLSVCLSVCLPACLPVCLSVCLSVYDNLRFFLVRGCLCWVVCVFVCQIVCLPDCLFACLICPCCGVIVLCIVQHFFFYLFCSALVCFFHI